MIKKSIILISWVFFAAPLMAAEWDVEVSESLVTASITGEITWGDRQRFVFFKGDCKSVRHVFSSYTKASADFEDLKDRVLAIEFNGEVIGTTLIEARKGMGGHLLLFDLGSYNRNLLLNHLKKHKKISIVFVDGNGVKASDYFDVPNNEWSTNGISEAFDKAHKACSS